MMGPGRPLHERCGREAPHCETHDAAALAWTPKDKRTEAPRGGNCTPSWHELGHGEIKICRSFGPPSVGVDRPATLLAPRAKRRIWL